MSPTAKIIFARDPIKVEGGYMYRISGSAEHRCCNSKAMRKIGHVCSSQKHGGGNFFNTSKTADQKEAEFKEWFKNRGKK